MKELIIVGGGPAAMSAGVYAARMKLGVSLVTKKFGGHLTQTDVIENYLGFDNISGPELAEKFEEHLRCYDIELSEDTSVKKIYQKENTVYLELDNGEVIEAKTAIVATGSERKKLNVAGEEEFLNKGVSYCTVCDGPLFQDEDVAIIGGSYAGTKAALYMSRIAKKVYLIEIENELRGEKITLEKLKDTGNVEIITNAKTKEIYGSDCVEGLKYIDLKSDCEKDLKVNGVSIEIGITPNSDIVEAEKNSHGQIKVNDNMQTSKNRIFAVGDVNDKGPEQVAVAVGQGCTAALEVDKLISSLEKD